MQITYGIIYVIVYSVFGHENNYSNNFLLHFIVTLWNNLWNNLASNRVFRANHSKFVTKELSKAIMLRSKYHKVETKKNFFERLNRRSKFKYKKLRTVFIYLLKNPERTTMKVLTKAI